MKKIKCRLQRTQLYCFVVIMVMGLLLPLPVQANPVVDYSKNGTGSLILCFETDEDKPVGIEGAEFTIYFVEKLVEEKDGSQLLEWTDEFKNCGISLENLTTSQKEGVAKKLLLYAQTQNIEGSTQVTDSTGHTTFERLQFGSYLVVLTRTPKEGWTLNSFLISVPNEDVNGNLIYEVPASPKSWRVPVTDDPDDPKNPDEPKDPDDPDDPKDPDEPKDPDDPDDPKNPDEPKDPDDPDDPKDPEDPKNPDNPEDPKDPEEPKEPKKPEKPEKPKLPQTGHNLFIPLGLFVISLLSFVAGWMVQRKKAGKILMCGGGLLFAAMLVVACYQNYDERICNQDADKMYMAYENALKTGFDKETENGNHSIELNDKTGVKMPFIKVEDMDCIGSVSIPSIDITLPVGSECTRSGLKKVPCRYVGSAMDNSLVIAAHNYDRHFGKLALLQAGDEVRFTDVEGNEFFYEVIGTEKLGAYDVEQMISGDWDLTLFTCTYGGEKRIAVRCSVKF